MKKFYWIAAFLLSAAAAVFAEQVIVRPRSGITILDEGTAQSNVNVSSLNFVGPGISATVDGGTATITVNATGGGGGGGSVNFYQNNQFKVSLATLNVSGDIQAQVEGTSATLRVDLSTLTTRLNNVATDTTTLKTRLDNVATDTSTLKIRIDNLDSSTATLRTALNQATNSLQSQHYVIVSTNLAANITISSLTVTGTASSTSPFIAGQFYALRPSTFGFVEIGTATIRQRLTVGATHYNNLATFIGDSAKLFIEPTDSLANNSTLNSPEILMQAKTDTDLSPSITVSVSSMSIALQKYGSGQHQSRLAVRSYAGTDINTLNLNSDGSAQFYPQGNGIPAGSIFSVADSTFLINSGKIGLNLAFNDIPSSVFDVSNGSVTIRGTGAGINVTGGASRFLDTYVSSLTVSQASVTINGVPYKFPSSQGGNGQVLKNDGAGTLTWSADNNSGGGGGGGSTAFFAGNVDQSVTISTLNVTGNIEYWTEGTSVTLSVNLSTLTTRANNLDSSTAVLTSRLNAVATDTSTLKIRIDNLDLSTGVLTTRLNAVATDTSTLKVRIDNLDSSTASIRNNFNTSTAALQTQLNVLSTSYLQITTPTVVQAGSFWVNVGTVTRFYADNFAAPGTINLATNPVDWSQLKNVPAGFADGTDDGAGGSGSGDGLGSHIATQTLTANFGITASSISVTTATIVHVRQRVEIPLSAASFKGTVSSGAGNFDLLPVSSESVTKKVNWDQIQLKNKTTSYVYWQYSLPSGWDSSTITYRVKWQSSSGTLGGSCTYYLQAVALGRGEGIDSQAYGTAVGLNDDFLGANTIHVSSESAPVTIGNSPSPSKTIFFRLYRAGEDSFDGFAQLMEVVIAYTRNKFSD